MTVDAHVTRRCCGQIGGGGGVGIISVCTLFGKSKVLSSPSRKPSSSPRSWTSELCVGLSFFGFRV